MHSLSDLAGSRQNGSWRTSPRISERQNRTNEQRTKQADKVGIDQRGRPANGSTYRITDDHKMDRPIKQWTSKQMVEKKKNYSRNVTVDLAEWHSAPTMNQVECDRWHTLDWSGQHRLVAGDTSADLPESLGEDTVQLEACKLKHEHTQRKCTSKKPAST